MNKSKVIISLAAAMGIGVVALLAKLLKLNSETKEAINELDRMIQNGYTIDEELEKIKEIIEGI